MKYLLILLLIISQLTAEDKKQKITVGVGAYIQTQPYKDVDTVVLPSPVIFFDNGLAYVRWTRAGIYFLGENKDDYSWAFSLTAQPRVYGYKAGDSKYLQGMNDRKNSFEGGLAFSSKIDKAHFEVMALTDIISRHETWVVSTEFGYDFKFGKLSLYPSLIALYQSSEFLDYYYGVTNQEAVTSNNIAYFPNAGIQLGVQTYIEYPITDNISTFLNIKVDKLSQEATKSPLVNDDYIYSGLISLIYTFQY
jgi:outer membrane protein